MYTISLQPSWVYRAETFNEHDPESLALENLNVSHLIPAPESDQDSVLNQYVWQLAKNMARQTLTWHAIKTMQDTPYWTAAAVTQNETSTLIGFTSKDGKRIIHYKSISRELEIHDCPTDGLLTEFYASNLYSRPTKLKVAWPDDKTSCLFIKRQEHDFNGITISAVDTTGGFVFRDDPFGTDLEDSMSKAFLRFPKALGQQHICEGEDDALQLRRWLVNQSNPSPTAPSDA